MLAVPLILYLRSPRKKHIPVSIQRLYFSSNAAPWWQKSGRVYRGHSQSPHPQCRLISLQIPVQGSSSSLPTRKGSPPRLSETRGREQGASSPSPPEGPFEREAEATAGLPPLHDQSIQLLNMLQLLGRRERPHGHHNRPWPLHQWSTLPPRWAKSGLAVTAPCDGRYPPFGGFVTVNLRGFLTTLDCVTSTEAW
jgi:hypothetical protein